MVPLGAYPPESLYAQLKTTVHIPFLDAYAPESSRIYTGIQRLGAYAPESRRIGAISCPKQLSLRCFWVHICRNGRDISPDRTGLTTGFWVHILRIMHADLSGNLAGYIEVPEVINLNRSQFKSQITFESIFDWAVRYIEYLRNQNNSKGISAEEIDREIKSIQYALGILNDDEYLFIYIDTVNNKRIPLTRDTLRNFIKGKVEFNHYQLMDTLHDGFSYQGIFDVIRPFSFGSVLFHEDKKKIVSISSLIGDLVNEEWGEYEINESQGFQDFSHLNGMSYPYFSRTVYRRKLRQIISGFQH